MDLHKITVWISREYIYIYIFDYKKKRVYRLFNYSYAVAVAEAVFFPKLSKYVKLYI